MTAMDEQLRIPANRRPRPGHGHVYMVANARTSRRYVGKTTRDPEKQAAHHRSRLSRGASTLVDWNRDWATGDRFQMLIVEENIPEPQLDERRKFWINLLSVEPGVYNQE